MIDNPAKRGDLVVTIQKVTDAYIGKPSVTRTQVTYGRVASITRGGMVKTYIPAGWSDSHPVEVDNKRFNSWFIASAAIVDVAAAMSAHPTYAGHSQPKPFTSLKECREHLRQFRLAS